MGSGEDRAGSDEGPEVFFGVGTLHPKVSLLAEMGDLPVKWLARMRCVMFWSKVLTSRTYDGRLLRRIAVEAVRFGRGTWFGKMSVLGAVWVEGC